MTLTVRPTHPLLPYLLPGLGRWWSLVGFGRVVTRHDYTGDGPSIGPVTARTMSYATWHDQMYRARRDRSRSTRIECDVDALDRANREGTFWGARFWQWALFAPLLMIAWHHRWGGWQDMPAWLWWCCAVVLFPICWAVALLTMWPAWRAAWLMRPWRKSEGAG